MWPTFSRCVSNSVDLSETFKTVEHSFSGTAEQKSNASVVSFEKPSQVDFLPKQLFNDFPRLNGLIIGGCQSLKTVKDNLFTEDFGAIQYLGLWYNQISTIEANAFQHLPKLKWINLAGNQLSSLPHQIFKNNPELIMIEFYANKINSITPDFSKNLNKLQWIGFAGSNKCINKVLGCLVCLVSKSELDTGLSTCYSNCRTDSKCASESGKPDNLSSEQIENNLDLIVSSGQAEQEHGNLVAEKTSKPEAEVVQEKVKTLKNETQEFDAKKFEEISQNLKELKDEMTLLIEVHDSEMKSVKQELAEMKTKMEQNKDCSDDLEKLKIELGELFKKEFTDFVEELNNGA
jgi:Leucine-rich repeat (LRR) protein